MKALDGFQHILLPDAAVYFASWYGLILRRLIEVFLARTVHREFHQATFRAVISHADRLSQPTAFQTVRCVSTVALEPSKGSSVGHSSVCGLRDTVRNVLNRFLCTLPLIFVS